MGYYSSVLKRIFDLLLALILLPYLFYPIVILVILSSLDTKSFGFFTQDRIGQYGKVFKIFKIRTIKKGETKPTSLGRLLRRFKLDELPQLFNVLIGNMSFVGPRPDVQGFANELKGEDRIILDVKPGITGPASIYFKNEEELLSKKENPEKYNREVIWKKKIEINKAYVRNYSFTQDLIYLFKTIF